MSIYQFSVKDAEGKSLSMDQYQGKVLLIVNTATKCGLAPQLDGLQELYERFGEETFSVIAFPTNQFANQEPLKDGEIGSFCSMNFGITFPILGKIDVNGVNEDPLYTYLKKNASGFLSSKIKWNFTKFLVDQNGNVVKRFSPTTEPSKIVPYIEKLL